MPSTLSAELPVSPCIGVCTLDDEDLCLGCRRHIGEIAAWLRLSAEERRRIMDELPLRRPQGNM